MGNHHDNIALDWVRGEIQDTLKQGQQALEAFVDNRDDSSRLRFCLNHLHQVHGTLQMVELYGAALLAEEMESLAQALLNETLPLTDERISLLMQGILQLPRYLDSLETSEDDFPLALLPLLNDFRAARNCPLLSDSSLFNPDLGPARFKPKASVNQRLQDPDVLTHIGKLQQMFRFAQAGLQRETDIDAHIEYLDKVVMRLIRLCQKTPNGELWLAAGAFIDTLKAGRNPLSTAVKAMIAELDEQMRQLVDQHVDALQQPVHEPTLKNLLYYVARAADLDSKRVQAVVSRYSLANALPDDSAVAEARQNVSGPGRDAIHSVVTALNEEMARLKDQLDLFVRAESRQNRELEDLIPGLHQVANTLSVLGLGIPRKVALEQAEIAEKLTNQDDPVDDGTLMDIAGALLYIEASLSGLEDHRSQRKAGADHDSTSPFAGRQLSDANSALLRESRNSLEQVKTAIVNFIASQWNTDEITQVPQLIHSIRGGLQLIPLDRAASMLFSCERFVQDALLDGHFIPDWQQLDTLADAITSIEYYLERLAEGIQDNEAVLKVAEDSLVSLGFPLDQEPTWRAPEAAGETTTPVVETAPEQPRERDVELVDDEILEIFVEEADEVLETINKYYPRFRDDQNDHRALSEVRRAFHTLKGSGRLVGATSIGELAWAVENVLNRVLDQSLHASEGMFNLLDRVIGRLPALVEDFRQGEMAGDVDSLIAETNALLDANKPGAAAASETAEEPAAASEEVEATSEEPSPPEEAPVADEVTAGETDAAPTPTATEEAAPEEDEDNLIDEEILEIFIEEAEEVLETINEQLPLLLEHYDNASALTEVRRAFHTLKGSGRMVQASTIAELSWSVENLLNRIIEHHVFMNEDVASLLDDVTKAIPGLVEDFRNKRKASLDTSHLEARANALAKGELLDTGTMPADESPQNGEQADADVEVPTDLALPEVDEEDEIDPVLLEIFRSETDTHLDTLKKFLAESADRDHPAYSDDLSRALHTLKGSAHTAGIAPIAAVVAPMERYVKAARDENLKANPKALNLLEQICHFIESGIHQLDNNPQQPLEGTDDFLGALEELTRTTLRQDDDPYGDNDDHADNPLVQLFLSDNMDTLLDADRIIDQWSGDPANTTERDQLLRELQRLARRSDEFGVTDVAELADAMNGLYDAAAQSGEAPEESIAADLQEGHEALINMLDQVAAGLGTRPESELIARLGDQQDRLEQSRAAAREAEFNEQFGDHLESIDQRLNDDPALGEPLWQDDDLQMEGEGADSAETPADQDTSEPEPDETTSDEQALDPEMTAIFLEEAGDLIQSAGELLNQWQQDQQGREPLRQLQRDIHTLRGGAGLADIHPIADLSHHMEELLEGVSEGHLAINDQLGGLLQDVHDHLTSMVAAISEHGTCQPAPELIENIRSYHDDAGQPVAVTEVPEEPEAEEEITAGLPADAEADESPAPEEAAAGASPLDLDPEMVEIFLEEAHELIASTADALHQWLDAPDQTEAAKTLQRDIHTLKGGARMSDIKPVGDLAHVLESLFDKVVEGQLNAAGQGDLLFACHDSLARMIDQISDNQPCENPATLIQQVEAVLAGKDPSDVPPLPEITAEADSEADEEPAVAATDETPAEAAQDEDDDAELISFFLDEARDIEKALQEALEHWRDQSDGLQNITPMQHELHTLKGGARLSGVDAIATLADRWDEALIQVVDGDAESEPVQALSTRCLQALGAMLTALENQETPVLPDDLFATPAPAATTEATDAGDTVSLEGIDPEVLEIFLEEAGELVDALDNTLAEWKQADGDKEADCNKEAQRILHTLKGGARLAELKTLGDRAHDLETYLIELQNAGQKPGPADWEKLDPLHDEIITLVEQVTKSYHQTAAAPAPEAPAAPAEAEKAKPAKPAKAPVSTGEKAAKAPAKAESKKQIASRKADARAKRKAEQTRAQQETIRVNAQLLEELVNLAGETSITRGRMEQQISDFSHTLDEMSATTERLREQLRRMEIETETQILFRAEQEMGPQYEEDFDPLEMDRYSSIQQLSRALTESASDLTDLRETMSDKVRDAETLLLQQSRTNTELQEGLMKTRMIPFSAMVPRLRRIVRQITGELDKKAEFEVYNAEGELDRTVLERMIAPLEHMLRNALDHGIESAEDRARAGKPESGSISLALSREGGEVVLRLKDDGAGIDISKVKEKALRQNMLAENEELSDREILQFILQPGFSTAAAVTQISGRGVGMDVVASEIKQLGGSLDINSRLGKGTTFTVRLPFTVSVNRALMVTTGEDFYAIPLNTIEGIVRVSTYELEEYYKPDAPMYEYAGQEYRLQYLGSLLNTDHQPKLQGQALPLPVILVRGADQPMALQVDSLMGSREIVVKSLGPQFGTVRGVSGATILGDGNVVVILDLPAMIRADILAQRQRMLTQMEEHKPRREERPTTVMVVDDSVTVRKVTSRLLERNGMDVLLAKDGLDAVAQLQDHTPDVILLDIEMPRMDGFEVASFVRHDENLKDVPICMITSRTGEKHRERAMSIGVNEYLGKPFQEKELLETILRMVSVTQ